MKAILLRIEMLLQLYFEERRIQLQKMQELTGKDNWLDTTTTKFMLRIGDRMLYNYVKKGSLISKKRGVANFYLESTVLKLMKHEN